MKKTYLYLIVVLVILVIAALGWYYYSSQGAFTAVYDQTCPSGTIPVTCRDYSSSGIFSGLLNCTGGVSRFCSPSYMGFCQGPINSTYLHCVYSSGGGGCGGGRFGMPTLC